MANSSNKTKNWNIYSTYYSPTNSSLTSSQTTSCDQYELAPSRRSSSEYLPCGRQRSVFPYGIVSEYDLKDTCIGAETSDKIFPGKLAPTAAKWRSSPNLESSNTARWGTKILQTSCPSPTNEDVADSTGAGKPRSRCSFRKRMHSCPSTPVNDFLRVEVPRLSSIMVQAQSLPLVSRPLQPVISTKLKPTSATMGSTRRPRTASLNSFERPKKPIDNEAHATEKEISKSLSEVKIEDGVIIIDNGKVMDLRKDKPSKKHKLKHSEAAKSTSYRQFQDAMKKFEDAQLNLEGEVNAKPKTFETKDKEQDFFNEHSVQTQFLDLFSSVKEKRKAKKGKKYRCQ